MTTPANAVLESGAQASTPAPLTPTRPLYWSIRRELWENRSIYIAPLIVAGLVLFSHFIRMFRLPGRMRTLDTLEAAKQQAVLLTPYQMGASAILFVGFVVGAFYCLDALYGERRERSILFWKSLPVSDFTTVLSKACIPLVVLPLLTFAIALSTQLVMLIMGTVVLGLSGFNPARMWARVPLWEMAPVMFYGLWAHVLWFSPLYGWILLVSSWAKRAPILWIVLPPMMIGILERITFQTSYFGKLIRYRLAGALTEAFEKVPGDIGTVTPFRFLSSPGLWSGLFAAALLLVLAARMRRNREPI
jgi:ABC-2 type transport system permease protein